MSKARARQPLSLKARAVALLAQREHSALEMRRKLTRILQEQTRNRSRAPSPDLVNGSSEELLKASSDVASEGASGASFEASLEASFEAPLEAWAAAVTEPGSEALGEALGEVDDVIAWLQSSGYLDESRFVESRLHVRSQRWGQRRIEQELAQHGLSLDAGQRAALASTELERACEQLARKFGAVSPEDSGGPAVDASIEARQMRFLLGRGFGADVARRAIRARRAGEAGDTREAV